MLCAVAYIADLLHRIGFIEKAGTGIRRILDGAREQDCPEPEFAVDRFVTVTFRPNPEVRAPSMLPTKSPSKLTDDNHVAESSYEVRLLLAMSGEMTRQDIQEALGLAHRGHFRQAYLLPALRAGLIEMTLPDSPKSAKQRYRLTMAGKALADQVGATGPSKTLSKLPSKSPSKRGVRHEIRPHPFVAVVLLAGACGDQPAANDSDLETRVDTIGGAVHVLNTGDAPEWELTRLASVGPESALQADGPEAFGSIRGVALAPDGALLVADGVNREVRVFGPDGDHIRTFGRQGQGPGEFSGLASVAWVGSKLLALDFPNGRVGEFSLQGEWLGQRSEFGGISGGAGRLRLYPVAADLAYVLTYAPAWDAMVFAGHDETGPTADTLLALDTPEGAVSGILCTSADAIRSYPIPFAPELVQHPGVGGTIWSAVTDRYRIALTRGADTLMVVERELSAEPVPDAEWEAGNTEYRAFIEENPSADCEPRQPEKPAVRPVIRDFFMAPDGHLWVEVVRNAGNRWEVFDAAGALVGTLPATDRNRPPAFAGERMAVARSDSLGLGHVDIYEVTAPPTR